MHHVSSPPNSRSMAVRSPTVMGLHSRPPLGTPTGAHEQLDALVPLEDRGIHPAAQFGEPELELSSPAPAVPVARPTSARSARIFRIASAIAWRARVGQPKTGTKEGTSWWASVAGSSLTWRVRPGDGTLRPVRKGGQSRMSRCGHLDSHRSTGGCDGVDAKQTRDTVREMRETRRMAQLPQVKLDLWVSEANHVVARIVNVGGGPSCQSRHNPPLRAFPRRRPSNRNPRMEDPSADAGRQDRSFHFPSVDEGRILILLTGLSRRTTPLRHRVHAPTASVRFTRSTRN